MKLLEVMFRDAITEPGGNNPSTHFRDGPYDISLDAGLVTLAAKGGGATRLVPLTNVKYMTPAAAPAKLAKGA